MTLDEVLARLDSLAEPAFIERMRQFGIETRRALGVRVPALRRLAKEIGRDHALAGRLWASGVHEARLLAPMIAEPDRLTDRDLERWVRGFDSWDICDQCCGNLFDRSPLAHAKAAEWAGRGEEFVKRAGFTLMACLAVHDKAAGDAAFERFFPLIVREAADDRNFVKKAVNWALRQIGKRNRALNRRAVAVAKEVAAIDARSARWIASDALRELTGDAVQKRLRGRRG